MRPLPTEPRIGAQAARSLPQACTGLVAGWTPQADATAQDNICHVTSPTAEVRLDLKMTLKRFQLGTHPRRTGRPATVHITDTFFPTLNERTLGTDQITRDAITGGTGDSVVSITQ